MRILYISADFGVPVRGFKGASVHVRELSDALVELGHEVVILTANVGSGNEARARILQVPPPTLAPPLAIALRALGKVLRPGKRLEREVRELRYNAALLSFAQKFAAEWRPDAVYERYTLFGLAGGKLATQLRVPHLLEVNAPLRLERLRNQGLALEWLARWCEQRILGRANRVLCVSHAVAAYAMQHGAHRERVLIQPNAVNPARFHVNSAAREVRTQLGFTDDQVVVGFVGSLKLWHGVEHLVEAVACARSLVPRLRVLIVGDGPARAAIEHAIREHDLEGQVVLVGNVPHTDVPRYVAAMDLAVAPYRDTPDFYFSPLKIFEYMAAGKPVVAPRLGQIPDIVSDGETGLLYAPGQVHELAERLVLLATRENMRAELGQQAGEVVREQYTWEATAQHLVTLMSDEASRG